MTAFIYEVLAKDPYIITDKYSAETKKLRPGRFQEHRNDQSVLSIASKLLENFIAASSMDDGLWNKPPFGVSRFQTIMASQLERWEAICRDAPREKDVKCDQLAESVFVTDSEV
jgi:hypothetical protein